VTATPDPLAELQDRSFERATATTVRSYPPERRLTAEQLVRYLGRREYAVIGTARPDGRPHAAMSMYLRQGTSFWLPTLARSIRARNLGTCPWLTLIVAENDDETHIAVIAEGPAEVVALDDVPADVRSAFEGEWIDSWIRLRAERVLSYAGQDAQP
jgi:hypothetical protein